MLEVAPDLRRLADLLRPALGLEAIPGENSPSMALATFAANRHRVGPLLYRSCYGSKAEPDSIDEAQAFLAKQVERNVRRELLQRAASKKFTSLLQEAGIAWCEVKGWSLGEALYGESTLRQSKDVDILVPPDRIGEALRVAAEKDYLVSGEQGRRGVRKALFIARYHREVSIVDPSTKVEIELHSRLLGYQPDGWRDPAHQDEVSLDNPDYVLYLLAHGATTAWKRLKWLCDLAMIVQHVSPDVREQVVQRARHFGCEEAVAAAMFVVGDLWDAELVDAWLDLTEPGLDNAKVQGHLAAVSRRLGDEERNVSKAERMLRSLAVIEDAPVFAQRPSRLVRMHNNAMLWLLWKL